MSHFDSVVTPSARGLRRIRYAKVSAALVALELVETVPLWSAFNRPTSTSQHVGQSCTTLKADS